MPIGNSTDETVSYSVDFVDERGETVMVTTALTSYQYGTLSVPRNTTVTFTVPSSNAVTTIHRRTETDDEFVYVREVNRTTYDVKRLTKKS